jgi:hypothetical protein
MATPFPASFPYYVDCIGGSEAEKASTATASTRRKETTLGASGATKMKERMKEEDEGEASEWRVEKGGSVDDANDDVEEAARINSNKGKRGRGRPKNKGEEEKAKKKKKRQR